jgi:hypothetical protein
LNITLSPRRPSATWRAAAERQARIERRAAKRIMVGGNRRDRGRTQFGRGTALGPFGATQIDRRRRFLGRRGTTHRGAHSKIDLMHFRHFGLPARQHTIGVVRLDPALEEAGGNRQMDTFLLHGFEIHPREPAGIDVFSDAGTQPTLHPRPPILFHVCHLPDYFSEKSNSWGLKTALRTFAKAATSRGSLQT